jgi:hypothetical protein
MKQIVEEMLDSLILAHRLEIPNNPIKEKWHDLYDSPLALHLRQGAATLLLAGEEAAVAAWGEGQERNTAGDVPTALPSFGDEPL